MSVALLGGDNEASCGREWLACGGWGQGSPNIQHGVLAWCRVGAGTDGGGPSAQRHHTGFSVGNWRHARSLPADAPHGAPRGCQSRRVRVGERRFSPGAPPAASRLFADTWPRDEHTGGHLWVLIQLPPRVRGAVTGASCLGGGRDRHLPGPRPPAAAGPAVLGVLGEEQLSWKRPHPLGPQCEVSWHLSPVSRVAHGVWLCTGKLGS